ncbi:MAG TPA: hypothetical protein VGE97_05410 [Nitrososphaera sp.]|jgi:hypothetical protein
MLEGAEYTPPEAGGEQQATPTRRADFDPTTSSQEPTIGKELLKHVSKGELLQEMEAEKARREAQSEVQREIQDETDARPKPEIIRQSPYKELLDSPARRKPDIEVSTPGRETLRAVLREGSEDAEPIGSLTKEGVIQAAKEALGKKREKAVHELASKLQSTGLTLNDLSVYMFANAAMSPTILATIRQANFEALSADHLTSAPVNDTQREIRSRRRSAFFDREDQNLGGPLRGDISGYLNRAAVSQLALDYVRDFKSTSSETLVEAVSSLADHLYSKEERLKTENEQKGGRRLVTFEQSEQNRVKVGEKELPLDVAFEVASSLQEALLPEA